MGTKKASQYRQLSELLPVQMNKKPGTPAKRITREERKANQEQLQLRLQVSAEASRLMNGLGISSKVTQVPEWMLGLAAYSCRVGIRYMAHDKAMALYPDFFETVRLGWAGDMTAVEMWFASHE